MSSLPIGTVIFLFIDIEGSARLWEQHPAAMAGALARHEMILRAAIEAQGGAIFKMVGDGVYTVFSTVQDALAAALAAQRALHAEQWPETVPLRVRVAPHAGSAEQRDGDYYGLALNRVARLRAGRHGGQVLLLRAAQELVRDLLPPGVELRDLGAHRLKDLTRPEHIFQALTSEL